MTVNDSRLLVLVFSKIVMTSSYATLDFPGEKLFCTSKKWKLKLKTTTNSDCTEFPRYFFSAGHLVMAQFINIIRIVKNCNKTTVINGTAYLKKT